MTAPLTPEQIPVSAERRAVLREKWERRVAELHWWGIAHAHDVLGLLDTADEVDRLRAQVAAVEALRPAVSGSPTAWVVAWGDLRAVLASTGGAQS